MICIKTGALAYLDNYGEVVRGDLFCEREPLGEEVYLPILMRVCERNVPGDASHAFISNIQLWFDENKTSAAQSSTLIGTMTRFNYDGL